MVRFYVALWGGKAVDAFNKLRHNERDDFSGAVANKLCPDFLEKVAKPREVITVTGTNGKTTTSSYINNYFRSKGYKTSYNDWGANITAGFATNLLRSVNIFNKPIVDMSILEADECTLNVSMGKIKPNWIVVTNICKDSLRRNAHPEYIFSKINGAFEKLGANTRAILNANDPISFRLAENTGARRAFFGLKDQGFKPAINKSKEIRICPKCGADIKYKFRHYRHIGEFYCPNCDFKMRKPDYEADALDLDNRTMTVTDGGVTQSYAIQSDSVYHAYNTLAAISFLREHGESREDIAEFFATQKLPEIRHDCVEFNGISYYSYSAKGQNISGASVAFEQMAKDPRNKEIVLCLDEAQDRIHPLETISWLFESDYELLNNPTIKKVVCVGHMGPAHKLRLLLAGVPEDRIVYLEDDSNIAEAIDTEGIEAVFVLFEVDNMSLSRRWRDAIVDRARKLATEGGNGNGNGNEVNGNNGNEEVVKA